MTKRKTTAQKNKRRIRTRRPTARNQKRQIASTQNQIIAIKKHLRLTKERLRWHCGTVGTIINTYPMIIPLTSGPSAVNPAVMNNLTATSLPWTTTMTPQPQNSSVLRSKCVINKQYVDLTISAGTENSVLQFTAFIVQLQPKVAQQTYESTGGMTGLVLNDDYVVPTTALGLETGYGAYINSQRFKIIKRIELETFSGASGGAAGSTGNTGSGTRNGILHRAQFQINYGSTLFKSSGSGETLASLEYSKINPEQKRFILIFSDNSLVDLEFPTVSMSSLITGYACE